MKRYALKGVNDDQHECSVCGRVELKRVMWLVSLDADGNQEGEAFHCGTTCGAKLLGYTQSKMATKVKSYASEVSYLRYKMQMSEQQRLGYDELLDSLRGVSWQERIQSPQWERMHEIKRQAEAWANSQEILISL